MVLTVDSLQLHYEQQGEGNDVLVLHGWGASIQAMRPVIDALKGVYRVTALDFPGFGESDAPPETFSVYDYAELTYRFAQQLGITAAHIVCHSFGGRVTILLAAQHPEFTRKIVFTDAAGVRKKPTLKSRLRVMRYKLAKRIAKGRFVKRALKAFGVDVEERVRNAGSADYRALSPGMRPVFVRVVNEDLRRFLKDIKSPSLLVWGENDTDTPLDLAKIMEKEIPDAGLVVLPGAGHYSYLDALPQYLRIVSTFFGG